MRREPGNPFSFRSRDRAGSRTIKIQAGASHRPSSFRLAEEECWEMETEPEIGRVPVGKEGSSVAQSLLFVAQVQSERSRGNSSKPDWSLF